MRRWKLFLFAGLVGIALASPTLSVNAVQKDASATSARLLSI